MTSKFKYLDWCLSESTVNEVHVELILELI